MYQDVVSDVLLFVEVVKAGSLSGAAKKLNISKPSVSRRLNQLETALKNPLIKRTTRKLSLTESGKILFNQCNDISATLEDVIQEISEHKARPTGKLKIGFSSYLANDYRASQMIAKFMQLNPDISIELHSFTTTADIDLIEKDFDLYFTDADLTSSKLLSTPFCKYKLLLCASPEYLQKAGTPKTIKELSEHNCLLHYLYEHPIKRWQYYEKGKLKHIDVDGNFYASRSHFLVKMARASMGIVLLPEFAVSKYIQSKELVLLLKHIKFQEADVFVTRYRHKNMPKKLQVFLDFIKSQILSDQPTKVGSHSQYHFYHYLP